MVKHWIVTKKKNKRKLVEAPYTSKIKTPSLPKGVILEGKEKKEILTNFDIWQKKQKAKEKT